MRRTTVYAVVVATALLLSVSGALGLAGDPEVSPEAVGAAQAQPAVMGASSSADMAEVVASLQTRLQRLPGDDASWAALALAYVEQARLTGDPSYYPKAEAAVAESLQLVPEANSAALASSAALAAARHDFGAALADADAALAVSPRDSRALAVRVDALTELGRYREQMRALRQADRRQPGLPVLTRYSYAFELRGRLAEATALLARPLNGASHSDRGFLLTQMAELERRRGLLDRAGRHLDQALVEAPGYLPALVSRARLAVARGDVAAAERRWRAVVRRLPLPEYLVQLGELQLHRGADAAARRQFTVVRSTTGLLADGGVDTDLEVALFEADHGSPGAALAMAREEWAQRRSIHVADALAWALHVNGRDQEALAFARQATRLGTREAGLWLHRGTIEAALGMRREAAQHLRRGLAADPGLSPWQADRARAVLAGVTR